MQQLARFVLLGLVLCGTAPLRAQQVVGISMTGVVSSSINNGYCGFNCGSATNTGRVTGLAGGSIGVTLFGDVGLPGVLVIGLGPSFQPCPGFTLTGIHNSLQIDPANLLVAVSSPALMPGSRLSCTAPGSASALSGLSIPAGFTGVVLTFQGLAFDQGMPTFTRAIEVTLR